MSTEATSAQSGRMCECHHVDVWHKKVLPVGTVFGPGHGECKGYVGSSTNGKDYQPCPCREFRPWNGPWDSRTGEPAKPISLSTTPQAPVSATSEEGR